MTTGAADSQTLRDRRLAIALFALFSLFYLLFHHGKFTGTDELGVYETTRSIFETGGLDVPPVRHSYQGRDGRRFSQYAVGLPLLAVPFYAAGNIIGPHLPASWRVALAGQRIALEGDEEWGVWGGDVEIFFVLIYPPLIGALVVMLVFLFERRMGVSAQSAAIVAVLVGGCSYAASMSVYFLRHTTAAASILMALYAFRSYRQSGRNGWLAAGSLAASATFLIRFAGVLAAPGLAVYLAGCLYHRHRAGDPPRMRAVIAVAAPFVAMLAAHLAVNQYKWGRWLGSPMAAEAFIREPILAGLQGFLLSPGVSIFVYSPLLLLLPWTALAASRSHRLELVATVVVFCSYLFFFAGFSQWTGLWSAPGPRYMLVPCVLLMLPLGIWLDRGPHLIGRIALVSLAVLGGLIQLPLLTADWLATVVLAGYESYDPPFSFVFILEASPILKMTTTALDGYVNLWLHKLARGWPGQPGQPEFALALLIAGALGCVWLGTVIVAQLRRTSTSTE